MADALNRTNRFLHDALGRLNRTTFADNSCVTNIFNLLGQRVGAKDQAGLLRQFAYDVSGQLTKVMLPQVPDPENSGQLTNAAWGYTYEALGGLNLVTDPKGRTRTNLFNEFGQPVASFMPLSGAQGETNVYNSKGQLWRRFDFEKQKTEFLYG